MFAGVKTVTATNKELRRRCLRRLYAALLLVVVVVALLALCYHVTHPDNSGVLIPEGFVLEKSRQVFVFPGSMHEGPVCLVRLRCPFAPAEALRNWQSAHGQTPLGEYRKPDRSDLRFRENLPWLLRTGLYSPDDTEAGMCLHDRDDVLFAWPTPEGSVVEIIYVVEL